MSSQKAYRHLHQRLEKWAATIPSPSESDEGQVLQRLDGFVHLQDAPGPQRRRIVHLEREAAIQEQRPALLMYDVSKHRSVLWADFDFASTSDLPLQISLDSLLATGLAIIQAQQERKDKSSRKHGFLSMHLGQRELILNGPKHAIRPLTKPISEIWLNPLNWAPVDGRDCLLSLVLFRDWRNLEKLRLWLETSIREAQVGLEMCAPRRDFGVAEL